MTKYMLVDAIKLSGDNPEGRTSDANLKDLLESIQAYGIIAPLVVDQDTGLLIEGHRRLECAKRLGLGKVPVVFGPRNVPRDVVFETINRTTRKMTGKEWTKMGAKGLKVAPHIEYCMSRMRALLGDSFVQEIAQQGKAINSISQSMVMIAKHLDWNTEDPERMGQVVRWILNGNSAKARAAVVAGISPDILAQAIESMSDIYQRWETKGDEPRG